MGTITGTKTATLTLGGQNMKITRDKIGKIITSIFIILVLSLFIIVTTLAISIHHKSIALASSLDNLHEQTQATIDKQQAYNNDTTIIPQEAIHQRFLSIQPIATDEVTVRYTDKEQSLTERISTITDECIQLETYLDLTIKQLEINDRQSTMRFPIDELEILFRIVEAEATGGTVEQKQNVAWCILNRMESDYFPNTITDVVFDSFLDPEDGHRIYQFSPIYDGRYYTVTITDTTKQAVYNVLRGIGHHNGTYFVAPTLADPDNLSWFERALTKLFTDGVHDYYAE